MIEVKNVTKIYHEKKVLDNLSFCIPSGGVTAIIGPNGAGKSTLLSCIGRLLPLNSGQIFVDGLDVFKTKSDVLARKLSILRQENSFIQKLRVKELVAFGRYPYSKGNLTAEDKKIIERSLEFLMLKDLSHYFLDELSGGQRQRAFVAMVLCQDTDYVFLDEPLNSLDMKHAVGMMSQIKKMAEELKKTMIVVIHDINFASAYSDYILAMKNGQVKYFNHSQDIMNSSILEDIFETPVAIQTYNKQKIGIYY